MRFADPEGVPAGSAQAVGDEPSLSRRSVLRTAAGAGLAGLAVSTVGGAVLATPGAQAASATGTARPAAERGANAATEDGAAEPVVVHLRDARSGEMDVFAGTSQARLRDPDLAARLVAAIR
jgi:nitrous oxide reductase